MPHPTRRQTLAGLATLPLAAHATAAPPGRTLALVEKEAGRVAFYDLPSGRRTATVALGPQPHEMVADPARRFAYVGAYGVSSWKAAGEGGSVVWVIDLARQALARTIDLAPLRRLHGTRMDANGRLYVLSETGGALARFDRPATDTAPARLVPVGGTRSHYFVIRRDGRRAYVADTMSGLAIMIDPEDASVAPVKRRIGTAPEGCALSPDERVLYMIDRPAGILHALDAATLAPIRQAQLRGSAVRIVTQPDGRLIVANEADRSLSRLRPDTLAEEAHLPLPAMAPGLTLAPGGDLLYAAVADNSLATIDLARFRVRSSFPTGPAPDTGVVF